MVGSQIIENFSQRNTSESKTVIEGFCYLKAKNDSFREYWATIQGQELLLFSKRTDKDYQFLHSLTGTFISSNPESVSQVNPATGFRLYPVVL